MLRAAVLLSVLLLASCGTSGEGIGPDTDYNGLWEGATSTGGLVRFQIASDQIYDSKFEHIENDCRWTFIWSSGDGIIIKDGEFSYVSDIDGHRRLQGFFISETIVTGTYSFWGMNPQGTTCVRSGQGTFQALWVR